MFVARTIDSGEPVEADKAAKSVRYICRKCKEDIILVKGKKVRAHFRHKPDSNCAYKVGETWQHLQTKIVILDALRGRGLQASLEVEVLSIDGDRRADVLVLSPQSDPPKADKERRLAIEVQYSTIDSTSLRHRTTAYMAAKVPVLWVSVVDASKFKAVHSVSETNFFKIPQYRVPFWISDIHAMHGHLRIYVPDTRAFWKGWLFPDMRWKNSTEGYDSDGNFHSSGGHWYAAAKTNDLFLEGPYEFNQLKIVRINHSANRRVLANDNWKYLVDLIAPGSSKQTEKRIDQRKRHYESNTDHDIWKYFVRIDDDWYEAETQKIIGLPILTTAQ
jgi:hypothetical protein